MEYKFRVWDYDEKKMYYQDDLIISFDKIGEDVYVYKNETVEPLYNYELMQYIGLKDRNGQEIYKGDVLEYTFNEETNRDMIVYSGNMFTYKHACRWSLFQDEIIGNVYENPELLEEK